MKRELINYLSAVVAAMLILSSLSPVFGQGANVNINKLSLVGERTELGVAFDASGTISVSNRYGAKVSLVAGDIALLEEPIVEYGELEYNNGEYHLVWGKRGTYDFSISFLAKVNENDASKSLAFQFLTAPIRSLELKGFPADYEIDVENAAAPMRVGDSWIAALSPDSWIRLNWAPAKPEDEGQLFYTADMTNVTVVAPGMIKQNQKAEIQIMQGEMSEVSFELLGPGEISQVEGRDILGWKVERHGMAERRLKVRFNRPQTSVTALLIRSQTALPNLPSHAKPLILEPVDATRSSGNLLLLSDGAVNLSIDNAQNLSQISPDQVPLDAPESAALALANRQAFGFRYSGNGQSLGIQVEDILPEVAVSAVTLYEMGLNDATMELDMNLEIRDAPLREFSLLVPRDYSILSVKQSQLSDYTVSSVNDVSQNIRLIFARPIEGRQSLKMTLEKNAETQAGSLDLPRIVPLEVKSVRGYVGVIADPGLKILRETDTGLTEVIPSFFPVKNDQLQLAYRLRESEWQATIEVQLLDPTVQAEAFHLFSLGEGVVYGSSIVTYEISGAPVQSLSLKLDGGYENVELSGANIRDWREENNRYEINFHSPISGAYSLLATYESRLNADAGNLTFEGAVPLEIDSERGYIVFVSPNQVELTLENLQGPLLELEPQELPAEYQIMVDAPIIASLQYTNRPFELNHNLLVLPKEKSIDQIVELAHIETSITKMGEVLYEANYVFKSKNVSNFTLHLPEDANLWKVTVDGGEPVVSRTGNRILIPIDNDSQTYSRHLSVKYTLQTEADRSVALATPRLDVPTLQTRWDLKPDEGYRLTFINGSIEPQNLLEKPSQIDYLLNPQALTRTRDHRTALYGLLFTAAVSIPLLVGLRRFGSHSLIRWLPAIAVLVGSIGLFLAIHLASAYAQPIRDVSPNELYFRDTVLSPKEILTIEVESEEIPESIVARSPFIPWLAVALVLPFALRWLARKWSQELSGRLAFCGINAAIACVLLLMPYGAAMAIVFLSTLFFAPTLHLAASHLVNSFQLRAAQRKSHSAAATLIAIAACWMGSPHADADSYEPFPVEEPSIIHQGAVDLYAMVNDEYATITLDFVWEADTGDILPILLMSNVITRLEVPEPNVKLGQGTMNDQQVFNLHASRAGKHEIHLEYQTPVSSTNDVWRFSIPSIPSLVYQGELEFDRKDCEIVCEDLVGIDYRDGSQTGKASATVRFKPSWSVNLVCKPRNRDTRLEESVFYAETVNSYRPQAGSIEGIHKTTLRIAQGELHRITIKSPVTTTITDVNAPWLDNWRFDPASQLLVITSKTPLKGTPAFTFKSQTNASALPYSARLELVRFPEADSEVGWLGLSVSSEEQFDAIEASEELASVSINDFPSIDSDNAEAYKLRRAYRYADTSATVQFYLAKVEPEIRVTSEELTSLSEDRVVHTATLSTLILRSGVFQLQLQLPETYDVEKISGPEMSHWTEVVKEGVRIATLHFKTRTEGNTTQYITLSGPGIRENPDWEPPHIKVVGASKQRGVLTLSPEIGLRFKVLRRDGVSQIDPSELGSLDRNRLGFRLLDKSWDLALQIEPVDPWIECRLLHDVTFKSGLAETQATLQYTIKNAGVKRIQLRLPEDVIGSQFDGQHISSFQRVEGDPGLWEVNLDRRIINAYRLQVEYQQYAEAGDDSYELVGIETIDTQLQESFLSLRAKQRLSLSLQELDNALAPVEWQQVPDTLRAGVSAASTAVYRTIQPRYAARLAAKRLSTAQVLPAEVKSVRLTSILSESGMALTRAVFSLDTGHKPHLTLKLPENARFWSCYVNGLSLWPVEKGGELLIPLERTGAFRAAIDVEVSYLVEMPRLEDMDNAFAFIGPQCDLPLENIQWNLYVPDDYTSVEWNGTLDEIEGVRRMMAPFELESLLNRDSRMENQKLKSAESLLMLGNSLAEEGNQLDAKRALETAYNLSLNDADFNEDARVQLDNLRVQQAMVGLTTRRNNAFKKKAEADLNLSQDDAQEIQFSSAWASQLLQDNNSAEENRALSELASRFLQHQDAALRSPSGLAYTYPEHGNRYTFKRKLQAEPWQEMRLELEVEDTQRYAILPLVLILLAAFAVSAIGSIRRQTIEVEVEPEQA